MSRSESGRLDIKASIESWMVIWRVASARMLSSNDTRRRILIAWTLHSNGRLLLRGLVAVLDLNKGTYVEAACPSRRTIHLRPDGIGRFGSALVS